MAKSPFKFLDSYTREDRDIFFGRDQEITELYRRVFESKILLVYGISGTGKSSLINCGLASRFDESDWLPLNVRRGSNIVNSLNEAFNKQAVRPLKKNLTISEKLQSIYLDHFKPIYLIFDQFEELFIFGTTEEKSEFIKLIKEVVKSETQSKILFIIREEFLAGITEFEYDLPEIFSNRFRVEKMKRGNAINAIEGPCKAYDIKTEQGFSEVLIDKLSPSGNEIELTYLQIYLDRVFNLSSSELDEGMNPQFSKEILDRAGSVSDLLGQFLDEQVRELNDPETGMSILKSFVSVHGTKRQMTEPEIRDSVKAFGTDVNENELIRMLEKFVDLRIIRERDESGHFELRHDALAAKIYEKFTALEKDIIEVRQFIENAFSTYEKRGKLLSSDDLKYIAPYEDKLYLSKLSEAFIAKSKNEITRARRRRRTFATVAGIALILVLSWFTIWALNERSTAVSQRETADLNFLKAKANNLGFISQKVVEYDPTIALRIAKYAFDLDSINPTLFENLSKIYNDNNFYRIIHREKEFIMTLAISPDGKTFLTASHDDTARLINLKGTILKKFAGHNGKINSIKFSCDGESVLTGSNDSTARIWDLNGKMLNVFKTGKSSVYSVAFSPDMKCVLAGSDDGAYLWNLKGKLIYLFKGHKAEITSVAFSPDGKKILTGSVDSTIILWNITGRLLKVLKGHTDCINSVIFSPDGNYILSSSDDRTARLWDLQGNVLQIFKGHTDYLNSAVLSNDGKYILTCSFDRTARLWDLKANMLQIFRGHEDGINGAVFSPDGLHILTVSYDKTTRIWDLEGSKSVLLKNHQDAVTTVAFSPDGNYILSGSFDKTACLWDRQGNLLRVFRGHTDQINALAYFPDGKRFITGSSDKTAIIRDTEGHILKILKSPENEITSVTISPDGSKIITGTLDSLRLYDSNGYLLHIFKNEGRELLSMAFSPDNKSFVAGSADSTARLRDLEGNILRMFKGHENIVHSVSFSPDGKNILTGSCDGLARLWDLQGNLIQVFRGHSGHVHAVAFSPDGKCVLTGSMDKTARLWGLDGNLLQVFSGYGYTINSVVFSHDGKDILMGLDDKTARLWRIKKSYKVYMAEDSIQELSIKQKIRYGIAEFSDVIKLGDEKLLNEAAEYYLEEINHVNKSYRAEYINNAQVLFNRLVSDFSENRYIGKKDSLVKLQAALRINPDK